MDAATALYERIMNPMLLIRRVTLTANHVICEDDPSAREPDFQQLDLFTDYENEAEQKAEEKAALEREKKIQHTVLDIKKEFGKNAVLKGMNLEAGATGALRNQQIGGHKA